MRQMEPKRLIALLRGELDWVVMKCLEKSRERRYDTVNGLARDIQRYLADEPVEARPPQRGISLEQVPAAEQRAGGGGSLVLLALVAGLALATSYGFVRKSERDIANRLGSRPRNRGTIADKASIEALAQKKIADDQKQLAIENASKAHESAGKPN